MTIEHVNRSTLLMRLETMLRQIAERDDLPKEWFNTVDTATVFIRADGEGAWKSS